MGEVINYPGRYRTKPIYQGTRIIWYLVGLVEALLAFRFFLRLFGANPAAGFTEFIYGVSSVFVDPFINVFRVTRVEGSVFEWTTLLAMFVYWVVGWAITRLLVMSKPVSDEEAEEKLKREDI